MHIPNSSFYFFISDSSQNPWWASPSVHNEQLQLPRGEIPSLHSPGGGVERNGGVQKLHDGEQLLWLQPGTLSGMWGSGIRMLSVQQQYTVMGGGGRSLLVVWPSDLILQNELSGRLHWQHPSVLILQAICTCLPVWFLNHLSLPASGREPPSDMYPQLLWTFCLALFYAWGSLVTLCTSRRAPLASSRP